MATAVAVSTATGCAGTALSEVFSYLWKKVVEEVKTFICLPRAITQMKKEVVTLENNMDDINAKLGQEQRRPKRTVETWLQGARGAIESSRSIGLKYEDYQQHKNCLGCCPNCLSRYRISRDVREWERNVVQLHSERSKLPPSCQYGDPTPRAQIPIQSTQSGIVASAKRSEDMKLLVTWLTAEDSNVRRIGIQGMGGVGKTSLLDAINNSEEVRRSFDLIIKVTVSKNKISDIQDCVANRLKLTDFPDKSNMEERIYRLRSYLAKKKYLLLLDDVWDLLEEGMWRSQKLQDLGVSLDDTGFKIVLTTRDKIVCKRMNVQETIAVEPLSEDDGWQLFRSRAFENLNGNVPPELEEVARKIAKECKGLPLAIIVVAAAMTPYTDAYEWDDALTQLQNVDKTFYELNPGVDTELFQRLKWSYDALSDKLQTCFLYFAAFPEDQVIDSNDVIETWIAEGIVEGNEGSYLHDIGYNYMSRLRDRCLIEVAETDVVGRISHVIIHDILRDLAIRIAEEHSCYFKAGQGVSHFPVDHQGRAKMSLMYNRLHSLPTTFACSSLTVLLLNENPDIKEVPESFLRELPSLKVLHLSYTGITSLPPSIGNLKHLAYLNLEGCKGICELPETIGDLNNLQFLNLGYCSQLLCLPERISELKRLRSLNIRQCTMLSHLPRGISKLVSLERLEMKRSNISLDFEEDAANGETKNVCFKDLQSLSRLVHFSVEINSPVKEGVMGNWPKMRCLQMTYQYDLPRDMESMKDLESFSLYNCDVERLPSWVSEFRKLAYLYLFQCRQLKELPAELQELPCLRSLTIQSCVKLMNLELGMGFPKLEKLTLYHLGSLECVRAGTAASGSGGRPSPLPMFKSLWILGCSELKTLSGEWDKLKCLENIYGTTEWWDAIEWEDPNVKTSLETKFSFVY